MSIDKGNCMEDLISVIVPIYRVEKYLPQCIQSIINQTYSKLEIILVDDGSDDDCGKICDEYAQIDKRIVVIHKSNGGQDSARKEAMRISKGKYIGYVDGDDWIEPDMYENLHKLAVHFNVPIVESGVIDSFDSHEKRRFPNIKEGCYAGDAFKTSVESVFIYNGIYFEAGVSPYLWSKLFSKNVVEKYQLWEDQIQNTLDDNLVVYPAIYEAQSIYISHNCYYHYRLNYASTKHIVNYDRDKKLVHSYNAFSDRIKSNDFNINFQIAAASVYLLLYCLPSVFDREKNGEYLIPYGGIRRDSRVVLYGAGSAGIHLHSYLKSIKTIKIVKWVDEKYKILPEEYEIANPQSILDMEFDYIIISVLRGLVVQEIKKKLKEYGIDDDKILWIKDDFIESPLKIMQSYGFINENDN